MKVKGTFPVRWKPQDGADGEGVTIQSQSIKYAKHTSGTVKPTSGWGTSIPTVENGLYLWTWTHIVYSDENSTDIYSVSRMGVDGKGIQSSVVTYCQQETSVNPDTIAEASWGAFPSDLIDGYWLYTRTVVTYSDGGTSTSYSVSQVGVGSYYAGTEEWYALSASQTEAPTGYISKGQYGKDADITPTGDWTQERPTANAEKPYIWNFSISRDSRDNAYVTDVICIGNFAKGISSIVETYAISAYGSVDDDTRKFPIDIADTDWTDEQHAAPPTAEKPYQWNRTVTTYNDNTNDTFYHVSAVRGADGKGTVYIDLDNESDTMLYDGQGTLLHDEVKSNIALYDNGTKVAIPPTFSIKEKSSAISAAISGTVLTVTACTASGYIIVGCTYNNVEYTARMSIKRVVGADKYEIILDHNAVTYNTDTRVFSSATITPTVYRTDANGVRKQLSSIGSMSLKYLPNGVSSSAVAVGLGGEVTLLSTWDSVDFVLYDSGGMEVDRESVPIGKVKNGPQGVGAMRLDLDNENDTMLYDDTNTACLSGNVESQATLYQGMTPITSDITWSCEASNCTASIDTSGKVTVTAMSGSSGSVTVKAQYGGRTYTALLTLKKIRDNAKYAIVCSPNAVTYNTDTLEVSSSIVTVQVFKTTSSGTENISTLPDGITLDVTNGTISKAYGSKYATVKVNTAYDKTTIRLLQGNIIHDSETIPICKVKNGEGTPGANAKSIYKNSFEQPATPTGTSPSGWSDDIVAQPPVKVEHQGNWVKDAEGWRVAPQIGNSQNNTQIVQFVTTEDNQNVYLRVKVNLPYISSVYYDKVYVGAVDESTPTTDYINMMCASQDTSDVKLIVATAGVHFLCLYYVRAAAIDSTSTLSHYAKYKFGTMPTWKSDAIEYNDDGSVKTWSAPYRVTTEADNDIPSVNPNLLYQTSFISTQMYHWVVQGGNTAVGFNGRNAYMGTNSSTSTYKELLKQIVYDHETTNPSDCPVRPDTWYTLSFWAKAGTASDSTKLATYLYPSCVSDEQPTHTYIDTTAATYVNGVKTKVGNSTDNGVTWVLTTQWKRYWMAFKTRDTLPDTAKQQLLFRLLAGAGTVYICMPKLEQGIGATDYAVNESDIVDSSANNSGFLNDRGIWVEAASSDTKFGNYQWNDTRRDYVSYEAGGEYKRFFVKRKGMVIADGVKPTNTEYWEQGHTVRTLVSNTAVIDNANIGGFLANMEVLKSQNGSLVLDGINGLIQLFHDDGYSWQVLPDGRQVLGVYTDDSTKGRHIQFDPEAKEIRIYDDSGTCVTNMNGETISSLDNIFSSANGTLSLSGNNTSKSISNYATSKDESLWATTNSSSAQIQIGAFETSGGTRLTVNGTIKAMANTTTTPQEDWYEETDATLPSISPGGQDLNGNITVRNYASVSVIVKTYSDSTKATLMQTKQLTTIYSNGSGTQSTTFNTSVDLNAGYHVLMISYTLQCPGFQSNNGYATAVWNITSASYENDIYLSRLFANGAAYGSSVNNFFAAMNVDGRMLVKAATINSSNYLCGLELSQRGLSTIYRDALIKQTVMLFFGYACYNTSSGTINWANVSRGLRADVDNSTSPTITKSSTAGLFTITFPSTWTAMGVSAANLFVTAVGVDSGTVATVSAITASGCTIRTSSGATAAYKSFRVKIEFMIP